MSDRYSELVDQLLEMLRPGFGGDARPDFVAKVLRLTRDVEREGSHHGYICEKAGSVRYWVGIACSPRKHRQLGLKKVEENAFSDAYRLIGANSLFDS